MQTHSKITDLVLIEDRGFLVYLVTDSDDTIYIIGNGYTVGEFNQFETNAKDNKKIYQVMFAVNNVKYDNSHIMIKSNTDKRYDLFVGLPK